MQLFQNKSIIILTPDAMYIYPEIENFEINLDDKKCEGKIRNTVLYENKSLEINENTDFIENGKIIWKYTFTELLVEKSIPTYIQIFNLNKVIISFRDGRICILLLHFIDEILLDIKPTVLFDFQSYREYKFSVMSFHVCPWVSEIIHSDSDSISPFSSISASSSSSASRTSSSLKFEIITFNSGDILTHWHLVIQTKYPTKKKENKKDIIINQNEMDTVRKDEQANSFYENRDNPITNIENDRENKEEDDNYLSLKPIYTNQTQFMGVRKKLYFDMYYLIK